ncbi:MAG: hypothetical protein JJE44_12345 [Flavobacteriaceae bacterium]|nr:hypothetical protein [Flavobacteriaceae bacterium]
MKLFKQLKRLKKINHLIEKEATGSPEDFAQNIGISRGHLYRLIGVLKDYGATIEYSRKLNSFYYPQPFGFEELLNENSLTVSKMENIKGGFSLKNFIPSPFMRRNDVNLVPVNIFMGEIGYQY